MKGLYFTYSLLRLPVFVALPCAIRLHSLHMPPSFSCSSFLVILSLTSFLPKNHQIHVGLQSKVLSDAQDCG
jgi:hypothetical protein